MATSSSKDPPAERPVRWIGRASVFSGRPDPKWEVSEELASELIQLWSRLPAEPVARPVPGGLGYRYSSLSGPDDRRWVAFGGVVRYESPGGSELRRDEKGEFERRLLESAPQGLLPPLHRG
jgi:hypothetical protein